MGLTLRVVLIGSLALIVHGCYWFMPVGESEGFAHDPVLRRPVYMETDTTDTANLDPNENLRY